MFGRPAPGAFDNGDGATRASGAASARRERPSGFFCSSDKYQHYCGEEGDARARAPAASLAAGDGGASGFSTYLLRVRRLARAAREQLTLPGGGDADAAWAGEGAEEISSPTAHRKASENALRIELSERTCGTPLGILTDRESGDLAKTIALSAAAGAGGGSSSSSSSSCYGAGGTGVRPSPFAWRSLTVDFAQPDLQTQILEQLVRLRLEGLFCFDELRLLGETVDARMCALVGYLLEPVLARQAGEGGTGGNWGWGIFGGPAAQGAHSDAAGKNPLSSLTIANPCRNRVNDECLSSLLLGNLQTRFEKELKFFWGPFAPEMGGSRGDPTQ